MFVTGSSMQPLLCRGDQVTLQPYGADLPRVGDVVAYQASGGRVVIHRVVRVEPNQLITRGDNCPQEDPPVLLEQLLGRVTTLTRFGQRSRVWGDRAGRLLGSALRRANPWSRRVRSWLGPSYRAAAATGVVQRLARGRIQLRVYVYERPYGREEVLFLGERAVGARVDGGAWQIRAPYRFLVTPDLLAEN